MEQLYTPLTFFTSQIQQQSLANIGGFSNMGGTISGNVVIAGNLAILGSQTMIDSTAVLVENNSITLNSNVTGTPTINAGILVNRGTSNQASLMWNETYDYWTAGLYGSESQILTASSSLSGDISGPLSATVIGAGKVTSTKIATNGVLYSNIQQLSPGTFLANPSGSTANVQEQPITAFGLSFVNSVNASAARATLSTVGKYSTTLASGSTTATATHNLGTTDLIVAVYDLSTSLEVEVDVTLVDVNNVLLTFATTIPSATYRAVIIG